MMLLLAAVAVTSSLVLAVALLACRLLSRRPAALRHAVVAAGLAAAAAAPALEATLPNWDIPILAAPAPADTGATLSSSEFVDVMPAVDEGTEAPMFTPTNVIIGLWAIGVLTVAVGLLAGVVRLAWMTRRCRRVRSGAWRELAEPVTVLESPDRPLLLTWGLIRPVIVVPQGATSWASDRIAVVIAHELAHIQRRDWAVQVAGELVRAVYWFNPLVWIACRHLRHESEQACDDAVLRRGVSPTEYASHLLAVARQVVSEGRTWSPAPAVVHSSTLERRIAAMLTPSSHRHPLGRGTAVLTVLVMFAVAAPLAALTLTARTAPIPIGTKAADVTLPSAQPPALASATTPAALTTPRSAARRPTSSPAVRAVAVGTQLAPGSISGVIRDASGGVLPGVGLTLSGEADQVYTRYSDGAGRFRFPELTPGDYVLVATLPGFQTLKMELSLDAGQQLERSFDLRIGSLQETITAVCASGGARLAPPSLGRSQVVYASVSRAGAPRLFTPLALAAQATPVRVGGNISVPRKTLHVNPICPPGSVPPPNGVVVILEAIIGADGLVGDVVPLRNPAPEFTDAAAQAVRQWQFTPTRLNNVPVPVIMTVTVQFIP